MNYEQKIAVAGIIANNHCNPSKITTSPFHIYIGFIALKIYRKS